jgi:radical SAM protein with 4Fe4S-binding SPASM domain
MDRISYRKAFLDAVTLLLRGNYTMKFDQLDFHLKNLSFRKRFNLFVQGVQMMMQSVHRFGLPPILQIEPANICNLNCLTCATGAQLMERPPLSMSFETFRNVIDQVKDYICFVAFWSWGEPFVNSEAFRMIRYAKDQNLFVHTSTNGHFLSSKEQAMKIVHSGLDSLIVSVDGLDQHTYERYRKGGELKRVIQSIEKILTERNAAEVRTPLVTLRFIVMKHNEHQVANVKDFAEHLGVDYVTFRTAIFERGGINLSESLLPLSEGFRRHDERYLKREKRSHPSDSFRCYRPYANLTVFSNGDVVSCENDYNAHVALGNVSEQSLRDILSSRRCRDFLSSFRQDINCIPFCQSCELPRIKDKTMNMKTYSLKEEVSGNTKKDN